MWRVIEGVGRAIIQEDNARRQEAYRRQEAMRREEELRRQEAYRRQAELQRQRRLQEQQRRRAQADHRVAGARVSPTSPGDRQQGSAYATNESKETIARVQEMLNRLGYAAGPVDGLMGRKTAGAIRAFQADRGLAPSGRPSASLVLSLQAGLQERGEPLAGTGGGQAGQEIGMPATDAAQDRQAGEAAPQAVDESLLIVSAGAWNHLPRRWRDDDGWRERQQQRLAAMVAEQVLGTEAERRFLDSQPLTLEEARQAFRQAGIEPARLERVEALFRNGMELSSSQQSMGMLSHVVRMNQFEAARLEEALREKARVAVSREARPAKAAMTLICALSVEKYDFERKRFAIADKSMQSCFEGRGQVIKSVRGHPARVTIDTPLRPSGIPVDPATAEAWVERLGGTRFLLAIPATLTASVGQDQRGHVRLDYVASPSAAWEVRSGQDLAEVLHRYGDDDLHDTGDTPAARRLDDFARPWWLDADDEVALIVERAREVGLDELSATDLFEEETGLTFAFRGEYGKAVTAGERSLADFLDDPDRRGVIALSEALGLPVENFRVISLPLVGHRQGIRQATLVMPRDPGIYGLDQALPDAGQHDQGRPFAAVEVAVTAERVVRLPDGQRLLLAGHPERLVVRRHSPSQAWQDSPVIARVAFERKAPIDHERVELAWRGELLWQGARLAEQDPEEIVRQQLESRRFAGADAFARREAAEALADDIEARLEEPGPHWIQARLRLSPYDFERRGWRVTGLSPEFSASAPEADHALSVQLSAQAPGRGLFLPMSPERARAFQQASDESLAFDALLALRVSGVDTPYGRGATLASSMSLRYEPVELILFNADRGQTIINEQSVRLRHRFSDRVASDDEALVDSAPADENGQREVSGAFFIKGVRLGDDFATAVDRLDGSIEADRRYQASVEARQRAARELGGPPVNDWDAFHHGVLLESTSRHESVAIYHEPPTLADSVTALARMKRFSPGAGPSLTQLKQTLIETYPGVDPGALESVAHGPAMAVTLWASRPRVADGDQIEMLSCVRRLNARTVSTLPSYLMSRQRAPANAPSRLGDDSAWFDDQGDDALPATASPYSLPRLFGGLGECPGSEVMVVGAAFGDDGRMVSFYQALARPARMAALEEERRQQAETREPEVEFEL